MNEKMQRGTGDRDIYSMMAQMFKQKHMMSHVDAEMQAEVVKEEMEELEAALDGDGDELEEAADVLFTVFLYCELKRYDLRREYIRKGSYNLQKTRKRDENGKVTDDAS